MAIFESVGHGLAEQSVGPLHGKDVAVAGSGAGELVGVHFLEQFGQLAAGVGHLGDWGDALFVDWELGFALDGGVDGAGSS